jgi:hypothetical protein
MPLSSLGVWWFAATIPTSGSACTISPASSQPWGTVVLYKAVSQREDFEEEEEADEEGEREREQKEQERESADDEQADDNGEKELSSLLQQSKS